MEGSTSGLCGIDNNEPKKQAVKRKFEEEHADARPTRSSSRFLRKNTGKPQSHAECVLDEKSNDEDIKDDEDYLEIRKFSNFLSSSMIVEQCK